MKITNPDIHHHRNGIHGAPFYTGTFTMDEGDGEKKMLFVLFDKPGHCAVFDFDLLTAGNLKFGENSWRGDQYEPHLRKITGDV